MSYKVDKETALRFGQRALLINGIYAASFLTTYIPFAWNLFGSKPLKELSDTGFANSNFMTTTMVWLGILNIALSKSNDYETIKRILVIDTFGFLSWFSCDLYHYYYKSHAYKPLFYFGLVPITVICMLHSYYARTKMT